MKPNRIATLLLPIIVVLSGAAAHAQQATVGTVHTLTGLLASRGTDGVTRVLAAGSQVREGDTLSTERNSYARVIFSDDAEVILQPESVLVVTRYAYDADKPGQDRVELGLAQGGIRSSAGKLARRNAEAMVINTPMGAIKGRATVVVSLAPPQR